MVKLPSCTIYYILSLHKIMDTLFKTKNNRCLLQQRLFKNFSSLLHFALDFQIIFGFQFFYQVFSDYLFVQHQLLAVVDVS